MFILEKTLDETTIFVILEFLNKIINSELVNDYLDIKSGTFSNSRKLIKMCGSFQQTHSR